GIRVVKVCRPKVLNALNRETLEELKAAFLSAEADPNVRVLILTGEGSKSFIAGADILQMKEMDQGQAIQFAKLGHETAKLLHLMPKPTIAAVNGYALGGGTE